MPAPTISGDRPARLAELTGSRDNNFDVLRLFAAALVLGSHSFPLAGYREPLAPHTLGTVGVEIFFAVSGFLVTRSWLTDPSPLRYVKKRALRILPGLVGAVLVTALVIGPIFTTKPVGVYVASRSTWAWVVSNVSLVPDYILRSVFLTNPNQSANGSLWTLPVEARAYVALAIVGLVRALRTRLVIPAAIAVAVLNATIHPGPSLRLASLFVAGSALYLLRDRVVLRLDVAVLLLAAWVAVFETRYSTSVGMLAVPYLAVFFAYRSPTRLRRLVSKGDVSYGVYVYAFPIQQSIIATFGVINPVFLFALAAPLTWLAGLASWRLVEAPMLRLKGRSLPVSVPADVVTLVDPARVR